MFRIIHSSSNTGDRECVMLTTDLDADANDFIPPGLTLSQDVTVESSDGSGIPYGLPFEYELHRKG